MPSPPPRENRRRRVPRLNRVRLDYALLTAIVFWNLFSLRAELTPVSFLDDSSMHEQMVRFATRVLGQGRFPLTAWFPYLGLGSPHLLHYQALPAITTGALGLLIGPDTAFRVTLYVLLSLWPVSVYISARVFGVGRSGSGIAAVMSAFVMSQIGVGYEVKAYLWIGFGVWTQLWGSMLLPISWGLTWRAIRGRGGTVLPVVAIAATTAMHYETAYLAVAPLVLWPLVTFQPTAASLRRALIIAAGAVLATAWITIPLVEQSAYAATNEILRGSPLENGYGAVRVLGWLMSGRLLDSGRPPILTAFAGVGLFLALRRLRADETSRALVALLVVCLLLSFGRSTFGALVDLVPGNKDIFFRRFMMGVQLTSLLLAGVGAEHFLRLARRAVRRFADRSPRLAALPVCAFILLGAMLLAPMVSAALRYEDRNARAIATQAIADRTDGDRVDHLLDVARRYGPGRTYAGMSTTWGPSFRVGEVPVFKYLEARDVDEVGYTLRTASLMTDPEFFFDDRNPSDYTLFGIRYLLIPVGGVLPAAHARLLQCDGIYCLWLRPTGSLSHIGLIHGRLVADRTDVGIRSLPLLHSSLPDRGIYLKVVTPDNRSLQSSPAPGVPSKPTGKILQQTDDLGHGLAEAQVSLQSPAVLVLSASYDGGWRAAVDGRPREAIEVAPALPAVSLSAGRHAVSFEYVGSRDYAFIFLLSASALVLCALLDRRTNKCGRRASESPVADRKT